MWQIHCDLQSFVLENHFSLIKKYISKSLEATKASILALNYPPLSKTTTFLGGFKKTLEVPNMADEAISGKQGGSISDEQYRSSATIPTIWIPFMVLITGLVMKFNF